jgi:hypothetical protein
MTRRFACCFVLVCFWGCGLSDSSGKSGSGAAALNALCQSTDAKAAFGAAICVCDDLALTGQSVLAHSTAGLAANVGVNGFDQVVGQHTVNGQLIAMKGLGGTGNTQASDRVATAGDVMGTGSVTVGGDLMVGGQLLAVGNIDVAGTLGVASGGSGAFLVGTHHIGAMGAYVAPTEPCACGTPAVDVAASIADAKTNAQQLSAMLSVGQNELKLQTGNYYVESLGAVGSTHVLIDGAVGLYVGGTVEAVGLQNVELAPGATLDLYVGGALMLVGDSSLGDGAAPGSMRIYLASGAQMAVGSQTFNASIYAPQADVMVVGATTVRGAIFAKSFEGVGTLDVDYAAPATVSPPMCQPPDSTPTGTGSGSGPGSGSGTVPGGSGSPGGIG